MMTNSITDALVEDADRYLIVFDGTTWHVRHVRVIEYDLERDEKVYRCDQPISSDHATLADVPQVADLIAAGRRQGLKIALNEIEFILGEAKS